ncbi:hypothetical protein SBA6_240013 [Candidatus Sulfopaludibacter sp. SbA6]|nr:hypothetical protein SBA6_240013 [Candidatus Sulfopaludibacter sp. SbA6]
MVAAIALAGGRRVSEDVAVAELDADLGRDVGELAGIGGEMAASGLLGNFAEQPRPRRLLGRAPAGGERLEDSDGINQHVALAHQVADLALGVPAAVIAAIGDDEQRLAVFLRLLDLVQREHDGIEQRGAAFRLGEGELVLDLLDAARQGHHQLRLVVEFHQEKLVVRVGGLEKCRRSLARTAQFGSHAAADIEDQAHGDGFVVHGEVGDGLFHLVVEDLEMLFLEAGYGMVGRIAYRYRNQHQVGIDAQVGLGLLLNDGGRLRTGQDRHLAAKRSAMKHNQGQQAEARQPTDVAPQGHSGYGQYCTATHEGAKAVNGCLETAPYGRGSDREN